MADSRVDYHQNCKEKGKGRTQEWEREIKLNGFVGTSFSTSPSVLNASWTRRCRRVNYIRGREHKSICKRSVTECEHRVIRYASLEAFLSQSLPLPLQCLKFLFRNNMQNLETHKPIRRMNVNTLHREFRHVVQEKKTNCSSLIEERFRKLIDFLLGQVETPQLS